MVEDRVTDGKRIAQLLASELSGREDGRLADVDVVDADEGAEPSADGAVAYRVAVGGDRIGAVVIYPDAAELRVDAGRAASVNGDAVIQRARELDLEVDEEDDGDRAVVRIDSGGAVKRAFDAVRGGLV